MILNLGKVAAGATLYVPFHTFNSAGASVTLTGLAVTDIEIYKNGSTTQRASDNGYTLLDTDGIDFDGITGIHGFSVDLSDNSDAGFYAAGGFFWIVVSSVTVDSQTINFCAAVFTIEPAVGINVNVVAISGDATAADNLETMLDDTAGAVPWVGIVDQGTAQSASSTGIVLRSAAAFADDTLIGAVLFVFGSTQGYWQSRIITDSALSGDTVTVDTWTVTPSGTITYKIFAGAPGSASAPSAVNVTQIAGAAVSTSTAQLGVNVVSIAANAITATSIAADAITDAKVASDVTIASVTGAVGSVTGAVGSVTGLTASDVGAIKTKTDFLPSATAGAAGGVFIAGSNAATSITTALTANVIGNVTGNLSGSVGSVTGAVGSVTGNVGGNVTGSVGSVVGLTASDVAAIKLVTDILSGMTELGTGSPTYYRFGTLALEQAPTGGSAPSAATIADAVWDEARAGHVAGGSFGEGVASVTGAVGSVASGGITAASLAADAITAAKVAADVTTELQSGLATAAALTTVAGYIDTEVASILAAVDTEVAAIKAKTDSLTFTVAGQVDANIQYVNDTQIQGTGAVGSDEWRKV